MQQQKSHWYKKVVDNTFKTKILFQDFSTA